MFRKQDGRRYVQFVCSQKRGKGDLGCIGTTVAVAEANRLVRDWVDQLALEVEQDAKQVRSERPAPTRDEDAKRAMAEAELLRLERAVSRHMKAYAMSEEDDPSGELEGAYLATLRDLREQRRRAAAEVEAFSATPSAAELEAQRLALRPVVLGLAREWNTLEPGRINELLRRLLVRVEVHSGSEVRVAPVWGATPELAIHQE
jgi:hypothetical protein